MRAVGPYILSVGTGWIALVVALVYVSAWLLDAAVERVLSRRGMETVGTQAVGVCRKAHTVESGRKSYESYQVVHVGAESSRKEPDEKKSQEDIV